MNSVCFRGRTLLRVLSAGLMVLLLALILFCAVAATQKKGTELFEWILAGMFLLPAFPVFVFMNNAFGVLRVDAAAVSLERWVLSKHIAWDKVGKVCYWVETHVVNHVPTHEPFLELRDFQDRKLVLISSNFPPEAPAAIMDIAREMKIPVEDRTE